VGYGITSFLQVISFVYIYSLSAGKLKVSACPIGDTFFDELCLLMTIAFVVKNLDSRLRGNDKKASPHTLCHL
jgi:hypothetical protein